MRVKFAPAGLASGRIVRTIPLGGETVAGRE